ncbi:ribonuclease H-like YkuK family protein [Aquibacillus saliphilus]|uniref:ribonuclease H-like YkuK family protein n=1 Tax=Aquibacillus saliphilus TaxID=1909422 RepID=UPI001CF0B0C6|nr:ribonuclease H-like YkuK family protein [Aquibacillus saliphilus]
MKDEAFPFIEELKFNNLSEKNMSFNRVFKHIEDFMLMDQKANYRLIVGTDSQVHKSHTIFITGIVIQRYKKGAWGCILPVKFERKYLNLHEKISMETTLTEQVAYLFNEERKSKLIDIVLPHIYRGSSFTMEGHIDIGLEKRSLTRFLASEMMFRIESAGLEPVVKPDSFVSSSYANRYTKY